MFIDRPSFMRRLRSLVWEDGGTIQLLLGGVFFLLFFLGPARYEDSAGYLSGEGFRSPLFPMVVGLVSLCGAYREWALVALQLAAGYFAVCWFSRQLAAVVRLPRHGVAVLMVLCATPYFGITIRTGNAILTEGIAYPLFLVAMGWLVRCVADKHPRSGAFFFVATALLVLARKQFLFLFVVSVPLLYFLRASGMAWPRIARLTLLLAVLVPGTFAVEAINGYIRHGSLIPVSYTGKQLLVGALFVADAQDAQAIGDPDEQRYFQKLYSVARAGTMTLDTLAEAQRQRTTSTFQHFVANYINLIESIDDVFSESYRDAYRTEGERVTMMDRVAKDVAITLIRRHSVQYGSLYVLNLIYGFGGHGIGDGYGLRGAYFLALQVMLLLLVVTAARGRPDMANVRNVVLFLTLVHWANVFEVAILEVALDRYTFYTATLWMAVIAGVLSLSVVHRPPLDPEPRG